MNFYATVFMRGYTAICKTIFVKELPLNLLKNYPYPDFRNGIYLGLSRILYIETLSEMDDMLIGCWDVRISPTEITFIKM